MTFSIVAADGSGDLGVAVASKFPAVGAVVPWAVAGVGAVATQSWANTSYGPEGLQLLRDGGTAEEAMIQLLEADPGREQRQVGIVGSAGDVASFTGARCMAWAGGRIGDGHAVQGNILAGPEVIAAMSRAFEETGGELVDRVLAALLAGDRAGGDRRGRQSAALLVVRPRGGYGGYTDRYVDLRVDDHPSAPVELARVFGSYDRELLIRDDPVLDASAELVSDLQHRLRATGHYAGDATGRLDPSTREAISAFAGEYNLEGRLRDDQGLHESIVREIRDITPEIPAPNEA